MGCQADPDWCTEVSSHVQSGNSMRVRLKPSPSPWPANIERIADLGVFQRVGTGRWAAITPGSKGMGMGGAGLRD